MNEPIIVRFATEAAKKKYKRKDAKTHSWKSKWYAVLKIESYTAKGNGFVVLSNNAGEIWWVSNQDVRVENVDELMY